MKKKLLAVCFFLLAAAPMSMAVNIPNHIVDRGTWDGSDYNDITASLESNFSFSLDYPGAMPISFDSVAALDPISAWEDFWDIYYELLIEMEKIERITDWDYLVLISSDEWYLFTNDNNGLLTTPEVGFGGWFNTSAALFTDMWFITANEPDAPPAVPEPGSLLLLGSGIISLGFVSARRRLKNKPGFRS